MECYSRWAHVADDRLAVFVSIPKCASKTILNKFELGDNRDWEGNAKTNYYVMHENHQRLKVLEERYNLSHKFIFCFVRNPYDRIVSWYDFHVSNHVYRNLSLNEWVMNGCETHWVIQNKTNWKKEKLSPLLQYNFIDAPTKVDFIGRMENFEEDTLRLKDILNKLFEKHGVSKRISFEQPNKVCLQDGCDKVNPSYNFLTERHGKYCVLHKKPMMVNVIRKNKSIKTGQTLTQESKDKIYELFKKDFEYFGYDKS